MMVADSLLLPCRRTCSAGASAPRFAQHPAQLSCLERFRAVAIGAFEDRQASGAAEPPGRRGQGGRAEQKRKARQKGAAPARPQHPSARGGEAARRGFAAVLCATRNTLRCRHTRVLHTPGHALARRGNSHDRPA